MLADERKHCGDNLSSGEQADPGNREDDATTETQTDYLEKARKLADSYSFLLQRKASLERQIEESRSWLYTKNDAIYKLSMGAHEESERVHTSTISNTVERTVLDCDKVLASMNREIQNQRTELLFEPYRAVCAKIELFDIALRSLRGTTRLVAEQLYVQRKKITEVCDSHGKPMARRSIEAEKKQVFSMVSKVLYLYDRRENVNGKTKETEISCNEGSGGEGKIHLS